jgi:pyruvate dehydrogenase E2 component (dihydrolipoamide acetyltransferase)
MAVSVVMPALEMAQETGKLVAWRKKEGETVSKGEVLLEIETDKAVMEVEALADGVLAGVKAQVGAVIPVGQTIAWIVRPGEDPPPEVASSGVPTQTMFEPGRTAPVAPVRVEQPAREHTRISPKARRLAQEKGIDLARLRGSGPDGEILASDVLAAVEGSSLSQPAPENKDVVTLGSIGRLMAERTTESWTTVPHFFVVREVNASALIEARSRLDAVRGNKITHTDLLVALLARVLVKHPRVNASWTGAGIRLNQEVNIAIAMAVGDGVVAAVVRNAHQAKLTEIAHQRGELIERARAGRLRPNDITRATFTISNLGMYHVDSFSAIISLPQAAILAAGSITDRVVAIDGKPAVRPMMTLTLSCDHRVVDGVRAAMFMNDVAEALREPEKWLE